MNSASTADDLVKVKRRNAPTVKQSTSHFFRLPPEEATVSWWIGLDRDEFNSAADRETDRMLKGRFGDSKWGFRE